jgi:DNA polymerase III sliding clamp (beta) subunit (PCNA family)
MKLQKQNLLKALNVVKSGLASKEIIEQSTNFIFQDGQVITFNDEIAVHCPIGKDFDIAGAVPAKELLAILTRFSGDEVDLEIVENELRLKCGRQRSGIKLEAEICLPIDKIKIPKKWKVLPSDFVSALKCCYSAAAKDLTYPGLANIHLDEVCAESSDNSQVAYWSWKKEGFDGDILFPISAVLNLLSLSPIKYFCDHGWGHFLNEGGAVLSCRISEGEFPDVSAHLDFEEFGKIEFPSTIIDILDKAGVFTAGAMKQDKLISLDVNEKGMLTVRGEGDYGWYEESRRVKWTGTAIGFQVSPDNLRSILENSAIAIVGEDKIKFETDRMIYLLVLEAM